MFLFDIIFLYILVTKIIIEKKTVFLESDSEQRQYRRRDGLRARENARRAGQIARVGRSGELNSQVTGLLAVHSIWNS